MNELSLIKQLNEPIVIFDNKLNIFFINKQAKKILNIESNKENLNLIFNNEEAKIINSNSSLFLNKNNTYKINLKSKASNIILKLP